MLLQEVAQSVAPASSVATSPVVQLAAAIVGLAAVVKPIVDHRKGKRRDSNRKSELQELKQSIENRIDEHHEETRQTLADFKGELKDLKAFVVGPDGENGIRGDVRELKSQVQGIVDRERDRLEAKAAFPSYAPPPATRTGS